MNKWINFPCLFKGPGYCLYGMVWYAVKITQYSFFLNGRISVMLTPLIFTTFLVRVKKYFLQIYVKNIANTLHYSNLNVEILLPCS